MTSAKTAIMIGDISGMSGIRALTFDLPKLKKEYSPSIVIANAENSQDGYGLSRTSLEQIMKAGVDVITTGNHAFEFNKDIDIFSCYDNVLRPENFYAGNVGKGWCIYKSSENLKIGVINLHTLSGFNYCDNPYIVAQKLISKIRKETKSIFIDLHGELTNQKEAFAFDNDGNVTAVCGTHTHVQTLDNKILPNGTAYITDLGMTGDQDSIIGGSIELSIKRMLTSVNIKVPPKEDEGVIKGCIIEFDSESGKALSIRRI